MFNVIDNIDAKIAIMLGKIGSFLISRGVSRDSIEQVFTINALSHHSWVEYIVHSEHSAKIRLSLTNLGVEFGIEEFTEFFFFSFDDVSRENSEYKSIIEYIFFNNILIKRCPLGFNYIYFIVENKYLLKGRHFDGFFPIILFPLTLITSITPLCGCKRSEYRSVFS